MEVEVVKIGSLFLKMEVEVVKIGILFFFEWKLKLKKWKFAFSKSRTLKL